MPVRGQGAMKRPLTLTAAAPTHPRDRFLSTEPVDRFRGKATTCRPNRRSIAEVAAVLVSLADEHVAADGTRPAWRPKARPSHERIGLPHAARSLDDGGRAATARSQCPTLSATAQWAKKHRMRGVAGARITVERAKDYVGVFRAYLLVIDGTNAGRVKRGKSLTVDVEPGHHELHLSLDWTCSPSVNLVLGEGEEVLVRCQARGNAVTTIVWGTFYRKRAIKIELVEPAPS